MKRFCLSQKTWDLISKLASSQTLWNKLTGSHDKLVWAIEAIGTSGEASAAPYLAEHLFSSSREIKQAAAKAIHSLMSSLETNDYVRFDEACRNAQAHDSPVTAAWRTLKPSHVAQFRKLPSPHSCLGLASCHGNGYVREAAVAELAKLTDDNGLPFLLLRLNDWVQPVREAAAEAVRRRIVPKESHSLLLNLHLVLRLARCGRSNHEQIITAVMALLREPAALPHVREGLKSQDRSLRRSCMKLLKGSDWHYAKPIFIESAADNDPVLRFWAIQRLILELATDELRPWLRKVAHDPFMPARREALSAIASRLPEEAQSFLTNALSDRSASVRETARFWIRSAEPNFNFKAVYRELSQTSPPSVGALSGLGEVGEKEDANLLVGHLASPKVSVRKAAIQAIAALDVERYSDKLMTEIGDPHSGVSKEATRALVGHYPLVARDLPALFHPTMPSHVRRNAFSVLCGQPFWSRGILFLETLRDSDERIAYMADQGFRDWLRRSGSMPNAPTVDEARRLKEALAASCSLVSRHDKELVEFTLRSLGL